jgi:Mrp family chromosome partitioning ATPase
MEGQPMNPKDLPLSDRRLRLDAIADQFADPALRRLVRSEATRRLLGAVQNEAFLRSNDTRYQLLVSSAGHGEGRSAVALSLAACTAALEPGLRVLYVEADPSRPSLDRQLGRGEPAAAARQPGFFDYLEGEVHDFDACVRPFTFDNLHVVRAGGDATGWRRMVAARAEAFAAEARQRYDAILYDGPAYATGAEAVTLARVLRDVLLVIRFRGPYREQVQRYLAELELAQARVVGSVLNRRVFPVPGWLYRS